MGEAEKGKGPADLYPAERVAQEGQPWTIERSGNAQLDGRPIVQDAKPDWAKNRTGQTVMSSEAHFTR